MPKKELTCFVIMPISDQDGYENGHFGRVYEHIIKPACIGAGFIPIRADEQSKTNYIVIDIVKKILESDMVVCDLSAKNPNVLYELGIRQAFNKRALLIKDKKTSKIFDIQGLRYIEYNETLRIDSVQNNISDISKWIKDTYEANESEINSLVQLLSIKPAQLKETVELSDDTSVILKAVNSINDRLRFLEGKLNPTPRTEYGKQGFDLNGYIASPGDKLYSNHGLFGTVVTIFKDSIIVKKSDGEMVKITESTPGFEDLTTLPF